MRIMTSNIWGDFFNNPTNLRNDGLFKVYEKYEPDVIGFQETAAGWYDVDLFFKLGEKYNLIGTSLCNNNNSTPMAIKKEYKIIADGHEQLKNTPDFSKSITWAVVQKDGKTFAFCNTHFWWMRGTESEQVKKSSGTLSYTFKDHCNLRSQNAEQLSELMHYLKERFSATVFAFGDMNAVVTEEIFDVYEKNGIKKLFDMAEDKDTVCSIHGNPVLGEDGKFHGKKATKEYVENLRKTLCLPEAEGKDGYYTSIDHIVSLGDGFNVSQYRVVEDTDALNSTDHSPVFADIY